MKTKNNILKKIFFIIIIALVQQGLYCQKEIIGKVEFYKSEATKFALFRDTKDSYTKNLNRRISKMQLIQKDSLMKFDTDSSGSFKANIWIKDSLRILVNKSSPVFDGEFKFAFNEINDTLRLRISDKKFAIKIDSSFESEFYNKYNEKQAELNFQNGKREILLIQHDWPKDKTIEKRKKIEKNHNVTYEYIFNPNQAQIRIIYRYNKVMRTLIGIKENVW